MPNIDIKEFYELRNEQKQITLDTLSSALKTVRGIEDIDDRNKKMRLIISKTFQAPKYLNTLEKIIYYFNRKQGITLQEIADIGGYEIGYLLNVSARISKKLQIHQSDEQRE